MKQHYLFEKTGRKICPHCGARAFEVTAHVTQDWVVDEHGDFLSVENECVDVTHRPDDEDIWTCANCGEEMAGRFFNEDEVMIAYLKATANAKEPVVFNLAGGRTITVRKDPGVEEILLSERNGRHLFSVDDAAPINYLRALKVNDNLRKRGI